MQLDLEQVEDGAGELGPGQLAHVVLVAATPKPQPSRRSAYGNVHVQREGARATFSRFFYLIILHGIQF